MYRIKQIPEDFIVREVSNFKFKDKGEYTYFLLKKKNWTSIKAIQSMAQRFNVSVHRFNIAGNKDKNAVTEQLVSVKDLDEKKVKHIKIKDIWFKYLGKRDERLKLGDLEFNEFEIVVRNLDEEFDVDVKKVPNYFGEQRFGGKERPNTHIVGKYLVKKDYEKAMKAFLGEAFESESEEHKELRRFVDANWGKWDKILEKFPGYLIYEKQALSYLRVHDKDYVGAFRKLHRKVLLLFVHAYQSYLWNQVVSKYLENKYEGRMVDASVGKLFFPHNLDLDVKVPLFGFLTKFNDEEIEKLYKEVLEKEEVKKEDFINRQISLLSSEGFERGIALYVDDFSCKFFDDELNRGKKKALLKFKLGSGSYATVVLNAVFG